MSADNWAVCPKCLFEASQAAVARVAAIEANLTADEFADVRNALTHIDPEKFRTFREDYEFYGAEEGTISWSYGGQCSVCNLTVDVQGSKEFWTFPVERKS